MNIKLFFKAITRYILGVIIVGFLLFVPANTFEYWNAWLFMGLLFIPMFLFGIIMMIKKPNLLKSRLDAREKESEQKSVVIISGLMFIVGFVLAGLNYRYDFIKIPNKYISLLS